MEKDLNIGILNDIYGMLLTENQRNAIRSYYDCDLSLGEIAENLGISRQAVRDSVNKGKDSLLSFEIKLGFKDKLDKLRNSIDKCLNSEDIVSVKEELVEIMKSI